MQPERRLSVLLVDDDSAVLRAFARALAVDFTVTTASSGAEALNLLRIGRRFDVLLSDVWMPDLDGQQLYLEVCAFAPEQATRMIFFSGGGVPDRLARFLRKHLVLDKSCTFREVQSVIRRLGGRATASDPSRASDEPPGGESQ